MSSFRDMNSDVRFGIYLAEPVDLEAAIKYGVKSEACGFRVVALCENLFWWNPGYPPVWDNFTVMTTILNHTKKVSVLTDVIDPVKRHPIVVAHMLSTLDHISRGRVAVGVGAGEISNFGPLMDLAKGYPSVTGMKEFIAVMRGAWESTADKPFDFDGEFFHVKDAYLTLKPYSKPHPRIYIGALAPNMRKVTAEIGEGWIPVTYTPETYEDDWGEIQEVAKRVGRETNSIDPGLNIVTTVLQDGERAKRIATPIGKLRLLGRPPLLVALGHKELIDNDLAATKRRGPLAPAARKDIWDATPEELARKVTICGTPDDAIGQIEEFIKAGVRLFALWLPYEDKRATEETMENYERIILPYFLERADESSSLAPA